MSEQSISSTAGASVPVDVLAVRPEAPGPWFIEYEPGWPITVSRWNPAAAAAAADGYDYESMTDEKGNLREFYSHCDARAAIVRCGGAA